jgi:hypothetical protein
LPSDPKPIIIRPFINRPDAKASCRTDIVVVEAWVEVQKSWKTLKKPVGGPGHVQAAPKAEAHRGFNVDWTSALLRA